MKIRALVGRVVYALTHPRDVLQEVRARPALLLLLANLLAQSISIGLSPVLTRIYTPADFGVFGAIAAIVTILTPLTNGRFELAIPRARSDHESLTLLYLCASTIGVMSMVFGGLMLGVTVVSTNPTVGLIRSYWYFVPLGLACTALYETLAMEASRRQEFYPLASSKLRQALSGVGSQIALGFAGAGAAGLLIGFIVNQAAGLTHLVKAFVLSSYARGTVRFAEVRAAAVRERRYPCYTSWSASLDQAAKWSLPLALSILWDPVIGGYAFLAERLVGRPLMLLSTSLLPVFVAQVSRALRENREQIVPAFNSAVKRQVLVSVIWTGCVVALAPLIVPPVFGEGWANSVPYIQAMALVVGPSSALHSVAHVVQMAGRQRLESSLVVFKLSAIVGVIYVGNRSSFSAVTVLLLLAAIQFCLSINTFFVYRRAARSMAAEQ